MVACSSSLPTNTTGTGGAATGTGGVGVTGTGGVSVIGRVPLYHRAAAPACSGQLAEAGVKTLVFDGGSAGPVASDGGAIACTTDGDCPPCANGQLDHCVVEPFLQPSMQCVCDECNTDQDCSGLSVCGCNEPIWANYIGVNLCIAAGNCRVDADCGPGGFCSLSPFQCGAGGYYCHTAADTCLDLGDCPGGTGCVYSLAAGAWTCSTQPCGGG
jgi:hypothetical protein